MRHPWIVILLAVAGLALAVTPESPRIDAQNGVVVDLTLRDPASSLRVGKLVWDVALETHAGDLRPLELDLRSTLHAEDGTQLTASFDFQVTSNSAHHPQGRLTANLADADLARLRTTATGAPEVTFYLALHDVGGAAERRFAWSLPLPVEAVSYRAYVSNAVDGTVSVIDLDELAEIERWTVGDEASHGIAVLPDGRTVYAGTGAQGAILAIDARSGTVLGRIEAGVNAHGIDTTPDGRYVFVGAGGTNDVSHLLRIDTLTGAETHLTDGLDPVGHIDVSPDGSRLYIANLGTDMLSVLDVETLATIARIAVGDGPNESRVTPDGRFIVVANWNSSDVSVVDAETLEVVRTLKVGEGTHGVAVTPDGREVWIVNRLSNDVAILDAQTWEVTHRLQAAEYANHVSFTPDGHLALVTNARANVLTIFDVASRTVRATIPVGNEPHEIAIGAAPLRTDAGTAQ